MLYPDAGPSSLVFFAECLKVITDSDLQTQNYKTEVELKPKLHQLWRIALCFGNYKLQLSVFLKTVWVFWPERVVPHRGNSLWTVLLLPLYDQNRVLRADRKASVNQTCQQSVFSPIGSLRYGDYGLRTTAGRALSFVCSTGLSRANIER